MPNQLIEAVRGHNLKRVKALLEQADTKVDDSESFCDGGDTALHAAAYGNLAQIATLLISHGANIHSTNIYGDTPFIIAIKLGHMEVARILLEAGAHFTESHREKSILRDVKINKRDFYNKIVELVGSVQAAAERPAINEIDRLFLGNPQQPMNSFTKFVMDVLPGAKQREAVRKIQERPGCGFFLPKPVVNIIQEYYAAGIPEILSDKQNKNTP